MDTIEDLNAEWEGRLSGLNAQLWANMQREGVTAEWMDEWSGYAGIMNETVNGKNRKVEAEELFEFKVYWRGELKKSSTKYQRGCDAVTIMALLDVANQMEREGVQVMKF